MGRLTIRNGDGSVSQPTSTTIEDVFYRLAEIEDILGDDYDLDRLREAVKKQKEYEQFMERWEQTVKIAGAVRQFGAERIAELVEADWDGRCVVLPCKRGATLWTFCNCPQSKVYSFKVTDVSTLNGRTMFNTDILSVVDARDVGKTVFLTREAAEAALNGGNHGQD